MEEGHREGYEKLKIQIQMLNRSIEFCAQESFYIPLLILLYAGIDAFAWLIRKDDEKDNKKDDFTNWVDEYFLPGSRLPCNSIDLYGARCAILHSQTAESNLMRNEQARPLNYRLSKDGDCLVSLYTASPLPVLFVDLKSLISAFGTAADSFLKKAEADPVLAEIVFPRANRYYNKGRIS